MAEDDYEAFTGAFHPEAVAGLEADPEVAFDEMRNYFRGELESHNRRNYSKTVNAGGEVQVSVECIYVVETTETSYEVMVANVILRDGSEGLSQFYLEEVEQGVGV